VFVFIWCLSVYGVRYLLEHIFLCTGGNHVDRGWFGSVDLSFITVALLSKVACRSQVNEDF
jgi:hypothetical protein